MDEQVQKLNERLHRDLVNLSKECSAGSVALEDSVASIRERVRRVASLCFGYEVRVDVFGSFATGLAVPELSDVDLVIFANEDMCGLNGSMMCSILGRVMANAKWIEQLKVLDRTKMPVIKLRTRKDATPSGRALNVDLTIALPSHAGMATVAFVKDLVHSYDGLLNPLTIALKKVLWRLGLADPFTGGLGSYALVLMVVASVNRSLGRRRNRRRSFAEEEVEDPQALQGQLGSLILDFLELFGRDFDSREEAVVCVVGSDGMRTMRIGKRLHAKSMQGGPICPPAGLVVDDPVQLGNNVGATCFRFADVQHGFADLVAKLLAYTVRRKAIGTDTEGSQPLFDLLLVHGPG